jgi:hypothetical protein
VWCGCGLGDLPPAAEALVGHIGQAPQRLLVRGEASRLHDRFTVEGDPQCCQVGELLLGDTWPHSARVKILDPKQESPARRSRKQPGKQRRTEVSQV